MKKILGIILALSVLLGAMMLICSCDKDSKGEESSNATKKEESSTNNSNQGSDTSSQGGTDDSDQGGDNSSSQGGTDDSDQGGDNSSSQGGTDDSDQGGSDPDIPGGEEETTVSYTITAYDAYGNQLTETVVIELFKNGSSMGIFNMRNGTTTRNLEKGYYTFEISPVDMDSKFYYDKDVCELSPEEREVSVTLYNYADGNDRQEIWAYDETEGDHVAHRAVKVGEGGTYIEIENPAMTYFIFTPTRGGIYKISYISNKSLTLGYYGAPHNVLRESVADVVDKSFQIEIANDMVNIGNQGGTTQLVLGLRSLSVKGCVVMIERIGDAKEQLPWVDVLPNKDAVNCDNYINSEFVDFDITNKDLKAVLSSKDGYYHLGTEDGPIIYIRISTALIESVTDNETIYAYLPSFVHMCSTGRLGKVFYDDDGNIVLKESYNELFYGYEKLSGTLGMYPLNEQLANAVKNIGEHNKWFDITTEQHIFGEKASQVYLENAWLFACCYENQFALGTEDNAAPVKPDAQEDIKSYAALVKAKEGLVLRTLYQGTLTIASGEGIKVVANNGTEYFADSESGKIEVVITANQSFTIVYEGENETQVVRFNFVESFN